MMLRMKQSIGTKGVGMEIKYVTLEDKEYVMSIDKHVNDIQYENRVHAKTGYVIWEKDCRVGIMVHCTLWDNLPFLNYIYINETYRNLGYGWSAMNLWEEDMKRQGYPMVLISTQVNETSQEFYRKLGYVECGSLLFHGTPMEQPMEMVMRKVFETHRFHRG